MVNLPLLWISALFYVALVSVLYVASYGITSLLLHLGQKHRASFGQAARKRLLLSGLILPPILAVIPTVAGATLRHMHHATDGLPEQAAPLAHHAMACELLFDRLASLGGLGMSGDIGRLLSVGVGGAAWILLVMGFLMSLRLLQATSRLEQGILPILTPPTPRLTASLERVHGALATLPRSRFYECAIPAAYSSVLGLRQARCVLSTELVSDSPDEELDAVVAHEASHLRSGDVTATFVVGLLNCMFFFLRPVRLLGRLWRESAELASDDTAVRVTHNPLAVASAILRVSGAGTLASPVGGLPAIALPFADGSACSPAKRVERLLDQAQQAALLPVAETPWQVAAGWIATGLFALLGVGLLLSSEAACVAHCSLELVQHLL